jgi:hypothetical protein
MSILILEGDGVGELTNGGVGSTDDAGGWLLELKLALLLLLLLLTTTLTAAAA